MEDLWIDSGVEEGSEKHVAGYAGEAVKVGDAHGCIVSWARSLESGLASDGRRRIISRDESRRIGIDFSRFRLLRLTGHASTPPFRRTDACCRKSSLI